MGETSHQFLLQITHNLKSVLCLSLKTRKQPVCLTISRANTKSQKKELVESDITRKGGVLWSTSALNVFI